MESEGLPHGSQHVFVDPTGERLEPWWTAYSRSLERDGIGAVSRQAIRDDAEYIVDRCILATDQSDRWPPSRERRGVVMGAVQSGKTASMMAVAAKALDRGVDAVVVLAGTRTALWLQTLERVESQLDNLPDAAVQRIRVPGRLPSPGLGEDLRSLYGVTVQRANRAVEKRRPLVGVVMKNVAHLEHMARNLHEAFYPAVERSGRTFHLLVIDDEADDSSIDDPTATDAMAMQERQVPRRILDLWESRQRHGETAGPNLFATYMAYTATPQANFLQDPSNPLAPQDFVVGLRTPGPEGDIDVRTPSYRVPEGLKGWYTGGDIYYHRLTDSPLCVGTEGMTNEELLVDGVRAYLVAAAVRMLRAPGRLGPVSGKEREYATAELAAESLAPVTSMLVHPSSSMDEHFRVANWLLAWSREAAVTLGDPDRRLGTAGVRQDMFQHPDKWVRWLDAYRRTAVACQREFSLSVAPAVPPTSTWDDLARIILEEVVPETAVAVINSDERADDRPEFSPVQRGDGWRAPSNMSTIFVSGNVMSRGLTLEGLTTTLFTRPSDSPVADTQMQMQRWFGYRGSYIDVCRVFASQSQLRLFRQFHDNDEALRREVLTRMRSSHSGAPDVTVLQGSSFRATGKITGLRAAQLWPGPRPFIQQMNPTNQTDPNLLIVAALFAGDFQKVPDSSARQGLLLAGDKSLEETADLLDSLRLPTLGSARGASAWRSAAQHLGIGEGDPHFPLYRGGDRDEGWIGACPYDLAAYLRLWSACLDRNARGFMSTDEPAELWSLVDLNARRALQPRFKIGLRFGSAAPTTGGPLDALEVEVRPMDRSVRGDDVLDSSWGSRGRGRDGILGDEFFDYYGTGEQPDLSASGARRAGSDGLVLFHLIARDGYASPTVAVGLSLPLGGPDQVHAIRRPTSEGAE